MHVTARRTGGPLACEITIGKHTLRTDEPETIGGEDLAPAPHELLPAALASCAATMIELYARRKGWQLGEVEVDVDYDHTSDPRRFDVRIRIPAELTAEQRERLERVAKTCPVRRALTADVVVTEELVDGVGPVAHAA